MLLYSVANACFEHSNFFTVKDGQHQCNNLMPHQLNPRKITFQASYGAQAVIKSSTTSFLTATTLIYAIGAGITAAAGTRLALQLVLDKGFK